MSYPNDPPPGYRTPQFPSLNVRTLFDLTPQRLYTLYYISDIWRFTLIWTLITYAVFHIGAMLVALFTHGWKKSSWKYLWAAPVVYLVIAGLEALLAGSLVGLMWVAWTLSLLARTDVCTGSVPSTKPATTR